MHDHSLSITIGGRLPRSALATLFAAVEADDLGFEWGDAASRGDSPEEFADGIEDGEPLKLMSDSVGEAGLGELEATCRSLRLHYVVYTEADDGQPASLAWWEPAMRESACADALEEDTPAVALAVVRRAISGDDPARSIESVKQLLDGLTPIEVPPLVLVDDTGAASDPG